MVWIEAALSVIVDDLESLFHALSVDVTERAII